MARKDRHTGSLFPSGGVTAQEETGQPTVGPVPFSGVSVDATGRIVDFIDPGTTRPDTPEERVRQGYARILVEEYGYPKDLIGIEVPVNVGHELRFADIAVYQTKEAKRKKKQWEIALLVETKKPNRTDGQGQLASYIFSSSAQGGVWTNGKEAAYFRRLDEPQPHLDEWTNIPRFTETWEMVGHYQKDQLRPPRNLKLVFERCHNTVYREGLDSEDLAMDMVKMILAKYQDEKNEGEICDFRCTPEEFKTADGRKEVARRVQALFSQVVADYPDVFDKGDKITIYSSASLAHVVNELQPFRFIAEPGEEQVYDVVGTAFEVYMASHLKGARGQWFTNRLVVNMMVEMMNPDENSIILDPACGPGGFLISSLRYVRRKIFNSNRNQEAKFQKLRRTSEHLFGIDIARKLVRVAKTNMILNGDGHGGIVRANSLDSEMELPRGFMLRPDAGEYPLRPTLVFANPPFGASGDLRQKDPDVLSRFDLGHEAEDAGGGWVRKGSKPLSHGVPIEILFLERCLKWLEPGGRLAIVIARGVLDNRDALAARQYLLTHARLRGVINCHPNTFSPFNSTKASILIVEKKGEGEGLQHNEDYRVFMAINQRVGQDSLGRDIYRRDSAGELLLDVNGQPTIDHDLDEIAEAWRQFERGEEPEYEAAWTVPLSRVLRASEMRFNPTRYAPEAERALTSVLELAGSDEWEIERLGDFARVFNGPRFVRPYAGEGVTSGTGIVPYFTPKAFFEERGESVKYLDLAKANPTQENQLDILTLHRDWIVIVDSGSAGKLMGRIGMATAEHEGAIGSNNLIRVIITDPARRAYVYQFLRSELGQALLMRNVYGTNQDHIEPEDVTDIPIPFPADKGRLAALAERVARVTTLREEAAQLDREAETELDRVMEAIGSQAEPRAHLPTR